MPAPRATIYFTTETPDFGSRATVAESAAVVALRYNEAIARNSAFYLVTFANNGQIMYVPTGITGPIMSIKEEA